MEITISLAELYLLAWALIATAAAIYWSSRADHFRNQFRSLMHLACIITKDENIRTEFEKNVVDKMTDGKEVVFKHFKE